jgi:hypothetical protein
MKNEGAWVVGCSEQRPNDVLAYEVVGIADGHVQLSRHDGVTYTAKSHDIGPYRRSRDRMLRLVLDSVPAGLRPGVRHALIGRWNRAWGVERLDGQAASPSSRRASHSTCLTYSSSSSLLATSRLRAEGAAISQPPGRALISAGR